MSHQATFAAIERGIERGWHLGGQLCVTRGSDVVIDIAVGAARPGTPMTIDTMQPWFSSTKPLVSVAIAQLVELGHVRLDDPIASFLPAFSANGKAPITIRHALTHTSGIEQLPPTAGFRIPWRGLIDTVCGLPVEQGWQPLRMARYGSSGWFALAEVVSTVRSAPFPDVVAHDIAEPAGIASLHLGFTSTELDQLCESGLLGGSYDMTGPVPLEHALFSEASAIMAMNPAGGGRGTARDLHALYRTLLDDRLGRESCLLSAPTIEAFAARHRTGIVDLFFGEPIEWGLGFIVQPCDGRVLRHNYGAAASPLAFGHAGFQSSVGFADPAYDLAAGVVLNGTPGHDRHEKRMAEVLAAIYADAGCSTNMCR